jgi:tetratricopeptide (TPR) repeat protein
MLMLAKPLDQAVSDFEPTAVNSDDLQYTDAKSYIMLEICLHQPLVPKREAAELARQVAEYIPPRPLFPKRTNCAQKAVEDFHSQVATVASMLLDEFREHFGDSLTGSYPAESLEEKRQKLVYHLNTSGKYVAFKEHLKYAVVKIVREKYLRTTNFTDNNELQAFLSELYVYLIDEMHVGLNKVLSIEDQGPVPAPVTDLAQLKHFAREAEVNGNLELATRFYQERIARAKNDPSCWLDYGTFCLYTNDLSKAEECFKECVAIDQKHLHGLLLNGVVCMMQDKNDAAETFFEAAITFQPQSIMAWTMFGLFYDGIGNEIGVEMALGEANKLNLAAAIAKAKALKEEEEAKFRVEMEENQPMASTPLPAEELSTVGPLPQPDGNNTKDVTAGTPDGKNKEVPETEPLPPPEPVIVPSDSIYMQAVEFLLDTKATAFTERALAHHLVDPLGGPSLRYYIALATLHLQTHNMEAAEESVQAALQIDYQNPDGWAILGHIKYLLGDMETAKNAYQRTLSFVADASEMHSIYLRLASIYLQDGQFRNARDTFLMACKRSPSCVSWLGVGIACYRLGEYSDAEDALTEANILNNLDPEVWAYLCLVCLQTSRQVEAEQAYKYTIKLNLQDDDLLTEINELQQKVGFGNPQL